MFPFHAGKGYKKRAPAKRRSAEKFRHSVCRTGRGKPHPAKKGYTSRRNCLFVTFCLVQNAQRPSHGCTPFRQTANSHYRQYTMDHPVRAREKSKIKRNQKCSCCACRAAISGGISCFLRLTTPGRTALPSLGSTPKASRTMSSAPWPQNIRSVAWFCISVNM